MVSTFSGQIRETHGYFDRETLRVIDSNLANRIEGGSVPDKFGDGFSP